MAGNQVPDIGQLTKILTIAIVITLILVAIVGVIFALKMLSDEDETPELSTYSIDQYITETTTTYSNQNSVSSTSTESISNGTANLPGDSGISDSVLQIESFTPDDSYFTSSEISNSVPEQAAQLEYYQTLYKSSKSFNYDSMSVLVTVSKGPLVVCYGVSNFIQVVDDTANPYYSFLNINITNANTGEIVATGGYNRENPSTEEQYLKIPMTGEFEIDIYGTGLDMDLTILSGTVPENPNAFSIYANSNDEYSQLTAGKVATTTTTDEETIEEDLPWWYSDE